MTPEENFWKWFIQREAEFFKFDSENEAQREKLFDLLAAEIQKVNRSLTFEFGGQGIARELVISAGGIKSAFPAVISLTKAAPPLERWKITAFRPRRDTGHVIQDGDTVVDPAEVQFTLLDNGERAGIYLFFPGMKNDDVAYQQIGYLLLDNALGEFEVETKLGSIEMLPSTAPIEGKRYSFRELPALFDRLTARLEKRSGKPS